MEEELLPPPPAPRTRTLRPWELPGSDIAPDEIVENFAAPAGTFLPVPSPMDPRSESLFTLPLPPDPLDDTTTSAASDANRQDDHGDGVTLVGSSVLPPFPPPPTDPEALSAERLAEAADFWIRRVRRRFANMLRRLI